MQETAGEINLKNESLLETLEWDREVQASKNQTNQSKGSNKTEIKHRTKIITKTIKR